MLFRSVATTMVVWMLAITTFLIVGAFLFVRGQTYLSYQGCLNLEYTASNEYSYGEERLHNAWCRASYLQTRSFRPNRADLEEAVDLYSQIIEAYPDDATVRLNRGALYFVLEDYNRAITDTTHLIDQGNDVTAIQNRAAAYYEMGAWEEGLRDYRELLIFYDENKIIRKVHPHIYELAIERVQELAQKVED